MSDTITRDELAAWQAYQIGKSCTEHPNHILKDGKYGLWCGVKTAFGWCNGAWPSEEFLEKLRKEKSNE